MTIQATRRAGRQLTLDPIGLRAHGPCDKGRGGAAAPGKRRRDWDDRALARPQLRARAIRSRRLAIYLGVVLVRSQRGLAPEKCLPPRSRSGRKGVFATRSPHRPNPLGLSAVRLERVDGLTLHVRDVDMLDGTPVLDIKPYVAYTDAIADAGGGWIATGDAPRDPIPEFEVIWEALALEQAAWVEARTSLPLRERATSTLALGPEPHPYRRIRREPSGLTLCVKDWRLRFTVDGRRVYVASVESGVRKSLLHGKAGPADAELALHREYHARWP